MQQDSKDRKYLRFNRAAESKQAAKELNAADDQAESEVQAEDAAKIDAYGHPKSDTMESNANEMYEAEVMAKSEREAEAVDHVRLDKEQKQCLAQCMGQFHGSLRTCAKKCKQ